MRAAPLLLLLVAASAADPEQPVEAAQARRSRLSSFAGRGGIFAKAHSALTKAPGAHVGAAHRTSVGKLRIVMSDWYCKDASHAEERPCINARFMKQMRAASDPAERQRLIKARSELIPADLEGRKRLAAQSRQGYVKMYKAYCAQTPPENLQVCGDSALRNLFAAYEKASKDYYHKVA